MNKCILCSKKVYAFIKKSRIEVKMEKDEYLKWGIKTVDLSKIELEEVLTTYIPEMVARRYTLIGIGVRETILEVAMEDPLNLLALEELKFITGKNIEVYKGEKVAIEHAIENNYSKSKAQKTLAYIENQVKHQNTSPLNKQTEEKEPVVEMVTNLLNQAVAYRASDLHIEQSEDGLSVRARIDGVLQKIMTLPPEVAPNIITRIKILAKLDITEKRLPQDGRLTYTIENQKIDIRISTLPTYYGEKVVVRLIYQTEELYELKDLGFRKKDFLKVEKLLLKSNGIILVTGPTGCGKTTTLAAMLRQLKERQNNIVTIEDPIENVISGITQSAVNTKIGYTFAVALRAILRQDPDIMMIGEIRDYETSSIAIRAAITGHLVLSTLHTNNAKSAVTRLIDMGSEPFLVKAAVQGVIAQKLMRRVCPYCKKPQVLSQDTCKHYHLPQNAVLYKGEGCSFCNHTGYRGRIGIYEVFLPEDEEIIEENGMLENAYEHMIQGYTTLEEYLKVIPNMG